MTASVTDLQAALAAVVPAQRLRPAGPEEMVAGVQPRLVVEPASAEELAAALACADREGLKVLVRGGGAQLHLGAPPASGDLLLSTRGLSGGIEHAPADQTASVLAGTPLRELQAQLGQAGQWLALDPALGPNATVGGLIATNASGARRLRFGGVRDQLIGLRVALPDGTLARGGGKVVKNVAGYDLPKLFVGALGTLGVIVSATFRLYPLPAVSRTVLFAAPEPGPLCDLALRVNASTLVPTAMDVVSPEAEGGDLRLAVRFESGIEEAVADQIEALAALAGALGPGNVLAGDEEAAFWRRADEAVPQGDADDGSLLLKASVLPTEVAGWLSTLLRTAREAEVAARWRAHAGHGLIFARLAGNADALASVVAPLRAAAHAGRGSLIVQDAPLELLRRLDVWGPVAALDVMRRMKQQFDPNATLNPGRFVGGI
ncbi:MAG TPA: FAD-binding oxidoreductase [Ktedonobacterales bacterium]|nr:FAD-binding oxidoreductase [Ktedonobacterales bacterium]